MGDRRSEERTSVTEDDVGFICSCVKLPNGVVVHNRLVKAAMEEGIAYQGGLPGPRHRRLYRKWAEGNWGIVITGNVQVDPRHLATPHDRSYPSSCPKAIAAYRQLATAMSSGAEDSRPLRLAQLSHPGLQSSSTIGFSRWPWEPAVAPISTRPEMSGYLGWLISRILWPRPSRVLTPEEWLGVVDMFVNGARGMEEAGWDGVQIHSAHGYLLAEWISPLTNPKPFALPGVPKDVSLRLHPLYLICTGIRKAGSAEFTLSVKINCSDFTLGGLDEETATELIKEIIAWKLVDILEVSGGTYSSPAFAMPETTAKSTSARQSLFAHFTTSLLPHLPPPPQGPAIILTGGMHDRTIIASSLRDRACDLVGIGRPACIYPTLPRDIVLNPDLTGAETKMSGYDIPGTGLLHWIFGGGSSGKKAFEKGRSKKSAGIPLVGAGISTLWHEWQLCRIGRGLEPDLGMHWIWGGLIKEMIWYGWLYALFGR